MYGRTNERLTEQAGNRMRQSNRISLIHSKEEEKTRRTNDKKYARAWGENKWHYIFSVILNEFICYVLLLVVVVVVGIGGSRSVYTMLPGFTCRCQCHRICVHHFTNASCYIAIVIFISYFYLFSKVLFIHFFIFTSLPVSLPLPTHSFQHFLLEERKKMRQYHHFFRASAYVLK